MAARREICRDGFCELEFNGHSALCRVEIVIAVVRL
jgi:hypothetical protein